MLLLIAGLGTGTLDGVGNVLFLRAVHPYERAEMTAIFISYRDFAQLAPPGLFAALLLFLPLSSVFAPRAAWRCWAWLRSPATSRGGSDRRSARRVGVAG